MIKVDLLYHASMIIGVIPARWNSSRFPGKPLANIVGKSLIRRTYENALKSALLDALVIATDDLRILEHVRSFGAPCFMTSSTCATGTQRVHEVVAQHFPQARIVVNIQGDEPCLDPLVIDALIKQLLSIPNACVTTPVAPLFDWEQIESPHIVKCVFDKNHRALYFSRAPIPYPALQGVLHKNIRDKAETPVVYYRHLGVYCFRRDILEYYVQLAPSLCQQIEDLEQLKLLEHGIILHVALVKDQATGVDTPGDLKRIEQFICQKENIFLSPAALSPL